MRRRGWKLAAAGTLAFFLTFLPSGQAQAAPDETQTDGEVSESSELWMEAYSQASSGWETQAAESPEFVIRYDAEHRRYAYEADGTVWFYTNVPKDGVAVGSIQIEMGENQSIVSVRRNDGKLSASGSGQDSSDSSETLLLTEPGSYEIQIYSHTGIEKLFSGENVGAEEMKKLLSSGQRLRLHYQLIDKRTRGPDTINAPEGFRLVSMKCGKKRLPAPDQTVFLDQDGMYELVFQARMDPEVEYRLQFELDRTAPRLIFEGKRKGTEWRAPVSFKASSEDAVITVASSRSSYTCTSGDVLTAADSYRLTVSDSLGNERSYYLFLAQSNDRIWRLFGLAVIGVLLGGAALRLKKKSAGENEIR